MAAHLEFTPDDLAQLEHLEAGMERLEAHTERIGALIESLATLLHQVKMTPLDEAAR